MNFIFVVAGGAPPLIPAIGAPVVPLPPVARPPPVVARPNRKRKLLNAILRERPALLRRLLRRKLKQKIVPALPALRPAKPESVLPAENGLEGSYVAVSGRPGQRTVHIVNGQGGDFAGTGILVDFFKCEHTI